MAFGTFDRFHPGHAYYLSEASKFWDVLVVVVARDETVEKVKWKAPRDQEDVRLFAVQGHQDVTQAVLGDLEDPYLRILEHTPDVLCFWYDQRSFNDERLEKFLADNDLDPEVYIIQSFEPEKYKSSKML